jgi:hypothetical protein
MLPLLLFPTKYQKLNPLVGVQNSGGRPVSTCGTKIALQTHMQLEGDQWFHHLGHTWDTYPDEVGHVSRDDLKSNTAYVLQAIETTDILVVPMISISFHMA